MLEFVLMTGNHSCYRITREMSHDSLAEIPYLIMAVNAVQTSRGFLLKMFVAKIKGNYTITGKRNSIMRLLSYIDMDEKVMLQGSK